MCYMHRPHGWQKSVMRLVDVSSMALRREDQGRSGLKVVIAPVAAQGSQEIGGCSGSRK